MVEPGGWVDLADGDEFAGYRIVRRVGMGILFLAIEPGLGATGPGDTTVVDFLPPTGSTKSTTANGARGGRFAWGFATRLGPGYVESRRRVEALDKAAFVAAEEGDAEACASSYELRTKTEPERERLADEIGFEVCSQPKG